MVGAVDKEQVDVFGREALCTALGHLGDTDQGHRAGLFGQGYANSVDGYLGE